MGIGQDDFVKVADGHGGTGEVLKVAELHYIHMPQFSATDKTAIARCLRPVAALPNGAPYTDQNSFENWPVQQLVKVDPPDGKPKAKARADKPKAGEPAATETTMNGGDEV